MKQNSSILFHHMSNRLRNSYLRRSFLLFIAATCAFCPLPSRLILAADKPEYLASFDPVKGFTPAQSDLTEVFLQIAGSLEYYGSPEPYLRHMKAEHERIEAKYQQRLGHASKAAWPVYMTDEYFTNITDTWTKLSPKLGLEPLTKDTGHLMRDAILGTRGTGTMLVEIFNQHQAKVYAAMIGKSKENADFDSLRVELIKRLHFNDAVIHDLNFTIPERDAVDFSLGAQGDFVRLFSEVDAKLNSAAAAQVKSLVLSIVTDVGRVAEAELEAALAERALNRQTAH